MAIVGPRVNRFRNVLVVADAASASDALLARARWLAEANGAALTLVDVIDGAPGDLARRLAVLPRDRAQAVADSVRTMRRDRLEGLAAPLRADGHDVTTALLHGIGFIEIIRRVLACGHDLVLKGALREPEWPALRGPDLHLLRKCPCPVWILNAPSEPAARRIMAAVDPDPEDALRDDLNRMVLDLATALAVRDQAQLDVVSAWHVPEEETLRHGTMRLHADQIAAVLADAERQSAWGLNTLTADLARLVPMMRVLHIKGQPADVLTHHADSARIDTLVMGTLARTGIAGMFIGNTAETVLGRVGCSVLAVKARGFVSPVMLNDNGVS